jgi:hypothetical protein
MNKCREYWKEVPNFNGLYECSNYGRVKRHYMNGKERIRINQKNIKTGYEYLILDGNGKREIWYVHRLVASLFIPNPDNLPCINHIDEDKSNNFVWVNDDGSIDYDKSNLEWCTHKYNCNYGNIRLKQRETRKKNGNLLTEEEKEERRKKYYNEHREEIIERERIFRETHREVLRARYKSYEKTDKYKEKRKLFRQKYPKYQTIYSRCKRIGDMTELKQYMEDIKKGDA